MQTVESLARLNENVSDERGFADVGVVLNEGAEALVQSLAGTQTYLARKPLGSGSITYLSLTLRDLFRVLEDEEQEKVKDFFRRSLLVRRKSTIDTQPVTDILSCTINR